MRSVVRRHRFGGQFADGKKQGQGTYTFADGGKYEGSFSNDAIAGEGVRTYANGNRYEGEFTGGQANGQGVYIGADGGRYEGQFTDGEPSGQGTFTYTNGDSCSGTVSNGQLNGEGKCTYSNGDTYQGQFTGGKPSGQGTYTFASGGSYQGTFEAGEFIFTSDTGNYGIATDLVKAYRLAACQATWTRSEAPPDSTHYIEDEGGKQYGKAIVPVDQWERHYTDMAPGKDIKVRACAKPPQGEIKCTNFVQF